MMAKVKVENQAGHITTGDVLVDLGFTPEEIRETEVEGEDLAQKSTYKRGKRKMRGFFPFDKLRVRMTSSCWIRFVKRN